MLETKELIQAAMEQTGLSDFGGDDFREPLQRLVDALNSQARLNDFGRLRAQMTINAGLTTRLAIVDYLKDHPRVREERIVKPVFIVGLPRTGTTALHHMLNQDSANRTLRLWEAQSPVPPPESDTYTTDPRMRSAELESTKSGKQSGQNSGPSRSVSKIRNCVTTSSHVPFRSCS